MLYKLADLIDKNAEWLGYFETLNLGKHIRYVKTQELPFIGATYRHFAGAADKITGKTLPMSKPFSGVTKK